MEYEEYKLLEKSGFFDKPIGICNITAGSNSIVDSCLDAVNHPVSLVAQAYTTYTTGPIGGMVEMAGACTYGAFDAAKANCLETWNFE